MLTRQRSIGPTSHRNVGASQQGQQPTRVLYTGLDVNHAIDNGDRPNVGLGMLEQIEKGNIVIKR